MMHDATIDGVANGKAVVHVRFAGRCLDVPLSNLDIGVGSSDGQVKSAIAGWLEIPAARLEGHVVDRHTDGNLTVRPEVLLGTPPADSQTAERCPCQPLKWNVCKPGVVGQTKRFGTP